MEGIAVPARAALIALLTVVGLGASPAAAQSDVSTSDASGGPAATASARRAVVIGTYAVLPTGRVHVSLASDAARVRADLPEHRREVALEGRPDPRREGGGHPRERLEKTQGARARHVAAARLGQGPVASEPRAAGRGRERDPRVPLRPGHGRQLRDRPVRRQQQRQVRDGVLRHERRLRAVQGPE